jgi:3D (Asp-Asp-Asp) domain-containing protein
MANIRTASAVRISQIRSLAVIGILGLAVTLAATREAKTATLSKTVSTSNEVASAAPIIEQPKIELLHDAPVAKVAEKTVEAVVPVVKVPTIPSIQLPKIVKPAHHTIKMMVTAYCACPKCCGPDAIGLTASGKDVSYNNSKFVAADKQFAFGTNLIIPGYNDNKPVEVQDRGGAIKGNKLDVFFPTHQEALEWGRRVIDVTVID